MMTTTFLLQIPDKYDRALKSDEIENHTLNFLFDLIIFFTKIMKSSALIIDLLLTAYDKNIIRVEESR